MLSSPFWQQKGGEQYGLSNYTFIGGHGAGSWSLRVQVVRPSKARQLAQMKNPGAATPGFPFACPVWNT